MPTKIGVYVLASALLDGIRRKTCRLKLLSGGSLTGSTPILRYATVRGSPVARLINAVMQEQSSEGFTIANFV